MTHRSRLRAVFEGLEGVVVLLLVLGTWPVSKRWLRNWGSYREEREREWLGDEFVSSGHKAYTRAVDVAAPSADVWQWVVQFGMGRAGFYSYELFERLFGIPVKNVESIEPSLQSLSVGDEIKLHPKAPGIPVAALKRARHICFGESGNGPRGEAGPDPRRSFSMYLVPTAVDACRLLVRGCVEPLREPTWIKRMAVALEQPIDFVMEQRMLRTIRRLAESPPRGVARAFEARDPSESDSPDTAARVAPPESYRLSRVAAGIRRR